MANKFIQELARILNKPKSFKNFIGYTEEELIKISVTYDIIIKSQFKEFLLGLGRSCAGIINPDLMPLLNQDCNAIDHWEDHEKFRHHFLQSNTCWETHKPFAIAKKSETEYYCIQTDGINKSQIDQVWLLNSETNTITKTDYNILTLITKLVQDSKLTNSTDVGVGELIRPYSEEEFKQSQLPDDHIETGFLNSILKECKINPNDVSAIGYSDREIGFIESLHNIKITGQLRGFLRDMGRTDGGIIGQDILYLYDEKQSASFSRNFQTQAWAREILEAHGKSLLKQKPFGFAYYHDGYGIYDDYFLMTDSNNPDQVYYIHETFDQKFKPTGHDLKSFLIDQIKQNNGQLQESGVGELL